MKTIGLIGGMSWESSALYYRIINEEVKARLGGLHSAKCILYSVDFEEIEIYQRNGEWAKAGNVLVQAARSLSGWSGFYPALPTQCIKSPIRSRLYWHSITAYCGYYCAEMLARG